METRLEAINKQIQAEKVRHKQSLDNENNLHQQRMRMLNSRKDQIKRTIKLEHMEETLNKATEDFNG